MTSSSDAQHLVATKSVKAIVIDPDDNVATVTSDVAPGTRVDLGEAGEIVAIEVVPTAHKIAIVAISDGEPIRKYGEVIGIASQSIQAGSHVHTHNLTGQPI